MTAEHFVCLSIPIFLCYATYGYSPPCLSYILTLFLIEISLPLSELVDGLSCGGGAKMTWLFSMFTTNSLDILDSLHNIVMVSNVLVSSGFLRDKTMNDKLKYTSNINNQNYPFCRPKLLVESWETTS